MSTQMLLAGPRARFAPWLVDPMLRNRGTYIKVAIAAVMINLFGLVTSLFSMTVYDRVIPNNATSSLVALSIGLAIVVVFDFILRTLRAYFVDIAGAQIDRDVGDAVFARLLALRLDLRKGSNGALTGIMRELETLRDFFASATLSAMVDVPFILLTLIVIAMVGGPVVLVPMVMIPVVVLAGWLTHPAMDRLSARVMSEGLAKQSVLFETVNGIEMIKAANAAPLLSGRWAKAMASHADSSLRQRLISNMAVTIASSANTISYAGVVIVGAGLIADHTLTTGGLIACSILSGRAIAPLSQIAHLLSRLTATRTAYRQADAMMNIAVEGMDEALLKPSAVKGRIEFRNVSFAYPGASEKALTDVNFTIEAGERVALLGRVGSGKSTVARLALGLYPPQAGVVMIDGSDIRQFDPPTIRSHFGVVMQEAALLSGSVRENIGLGRAAVDTDEMLRAADISGTHQFMGSVANGYDLRLADRGEGLSGGQRQSIAIARALAGHPSVLIFDEPSSAMDGDTEAALMERLGREVEGRTLILVTHRPALLRLVQRILVFDKGRLVADGPRDVISNKLAGVKSGPKAA